MVWSPRRDFSKMLCVQNILILDIVFCILSAARICWSWKILFLHSEVCGTEFWAFLAGALEIRSTTRLFVLVIFRGTEDDSAACLISFVMKLGFAFDFAGDHRFSGQSQLILVNESAKSWIISGKSPLRYSVDVCGVYDFPDRGL